MNKSIYYNVFITIFAIVWTAIDFVNINNSSNSVLLLINGLIDGGLLTLAFVNWAVYFIKK